MGISPWTLGDGKPPWTFGLEPDSGPLDITGLTTSDFSLIMLNISNQQSTTGTGAFSNLTAAYNVNPAQITYALSSTDAALLGMYDVRVVIKKGTINQRTFNFGVWSNEP
jgi:hypothetical protein